MRIRHGLRLDEPNDFDLSTQDSFLKLWDRISQGTFFALVVISSIALMVGGIGVMAIMSISVTERTREIGVRKALGARRAEILFQFLMEAAFLTSLGGLIGIALGAGIGWAVHLVSGLPDFAAVVVVRDRPRLLRLGRHLFRDVPGRQGLAPRPDRSSALRVTTRGAERAEHAAPSCHRARDRRHRFIRLPCDDGPAPLNMMPVRSVQLRETLPMKVYDAASIRNVALVGHSGSGKTQLASAILADAGMMNRFGKVDEGTTVTDYDEEEIARKHTLSASLAYAEWNKQRST